MTKRTLTVVLAIAVVAVFATIVIASSMGGNSTTPTHAMPGGQSMQGGSMDDQSTQGESMDGGPEESMGSSGSMGK